MSTHVSGQVSRVGVRKTTRSATRFMFSGTEIAAGILALLMLGVALFFYFTFLRPEQIRLAELNEKLAMQQKILTEINSGGSETTTKNSVKQAIASLESFKTEYLKPRPQGQRISFYRRIDPSTATPCGSGPL